LKILSIHNRYLQRGGEDECHDAKMRMLSSRGHEVRELLFDNHSIDNANGASVALRTIWSQDAYKAVAQLSASWRPDIIDIDNFFPLASPSIYYAARRFAIPTVQTLHNFRTICPGSTLFRNGQTCEECVGKVFPWPAIVHRCYRGSIGATSATAAMVGLHRALGTWTSYVTLYVALTEFARAKFIEGGLPAERVAIKPNFVEQDHGPGLGDGGYVFYAGRLTEEKGIDLLLSAWTKVGAGKLVIAGDGPLTGKIQRAAAASTSIEFLGRKTLGEVHELMSHARGLVFPSLWYEGLPGVIIESFSHGTPVIANKMGSMGVMIRHGETGWLTEPNNPSVFAAAMRECLSGSPAYPAMRAACREEFESCYTAETNYAQLIGTYNRAISLNTDDCKPHPRAGRSSSQNESPDPSIVNMKRSVRVVEAAHPAGKSSTI
jgi:glycosyltransferase involved in cell wall biosynthesis